MKEFDKAMEIFGVYDRGVPNAERIAIRINRPLQISNWAISVGIRGVNNTFIPIKNYFMWLGIRTFDVPSWIFIYTGKGEESISQESHTKDPISIIYWNCDEVLLGDNAVTPALLEIQSFKMAPEKNFELGMLAQEDKYKNIGGLESLYESISKEHDYLKNMGVLEKNINTDEVFKNYSKTFDDIQKSLEADTKNWDFSKALADLGEAAKKQTEMDKYLESLAGLDEWTKNQKNLDELLKSLSSAAEVKKKLLK